MIRNAETSRKVWQKRVRNGNSILGLGHKYILWLQNRNMSERTMEKYQKLLGYFLGWCEEQEISQVEKITTGIMEKYQHHLANSPSKQSATGLLSASSCNSYIGIVKIFLNWLVRKKYIKTNVAEDIRIKEKAKKLPKILTVSEIERIINVPNIKTKLGLRNRAILETLYSTGIRGSELIKLSIYDMDCDQEILYVRDGKGRKDRVIPIGTRACKWVKKYLEEARPINSKEETLFLTNKNKPFANITTLGIEVGKLVKRANIKVKGRCHIFRHALGAQMLSNGASTRYIQEILGHKSISTTQIYTKVSIEDLKQVHAQYHPREIED